MRTLTPESGQEKKCSATEHVSVKSSRLCRNKASHAIETANHSDKDVMTNNQARTMVFGWLGKGDLLCCFYRWTLHVIVIVMFAISRTLDYLAEQTVESLALYK